MLLLLSPSPQWVLLNSFFFFFSFKLTIIASFAAGPVTLQALAIKSQPQGPCRGDFQSGAAPGDSDAHHAH